VVYKKRPSVKKYGTFSEPQHDEIGDASPEEHLIFQQQVENLLRNLLRIWGIAC